MRGGKFVSKIELKHVSKIYPNKVIAVNDFNLEMQEGEFVVILGPSGCGKTSLLRMIAGLEAVSKGEIMIDGNCVNQLSCEVRDVSMVFQGNSLFSVLNVFDNMSFGLRKKQVSNHEIEVRVKQTAKLLKLEAYLQRFPNTLSTGQKQRVALGRAIVHQAKLILMDEPLANLDQLLNEQMRYEIKKIHNGLKATTLYVTHDIQEAIELADRIVVMNQGQVQQIGTPVELYTKPINMAVAQSMSEDSLRFIEVDQSWLPTHGFKEVTRPLCLGIRSDCFHSTGSLDRIAFEINVCDVKHRVQYQWIMGMYLNQEVIIKMDETVNIEQSQETLFYVEMRDLYLFDKESGKSIEKIRLWRD